MELKDKIKKRDLSARSIFNILKYSIEGIIAYAKDGKSIIIYTICSIIEIILGFVYKINGLEWILIICILGFILSIELVNTAIEAVCDAVTKEYEHSLNREMVFLFVHGMLHLLGYDHMNKDDEKIMFELQERILSEYGIKR